jgi:hypothetical protein
MFKIDRFTIIIIAIVAVLIVAAMVTVNRTGGATAINADYLSEDSPATPVYNAFLALQRGDRAKLREQYSQAVLAEVDTNDQYGPLGRLATINEMQARRLRILSTEINSDDPNQATVTFEIDNYSSGGLFDAGNTWSSRRTVTVVREDERWVIDVAEYFY